MGNDKISIVLVNWNTCDMTVRCIQSIIDDSEGLHTEIIVVDNASEDGSADRFEQIFDDIIVIRNRYNYGFAKGNNIGIKKATGNIICLINTDVEIVKGCIKELLINLKLDSSVGIVAPQALNIDGSIQKTARKELTLFNSLVLSMGLNKLLPITTEYSHKRIECVDIVAGCFWMIRRDALESVGFLDDSFFFYGEDRDYCKRMNENGWKIVYYPFAKIYHLNGGSSKSDTFKYNIYLERAYIQYWNKYYSGLKLKSLIVLRILYHLVRIGANSFAFIISAGLLKRAKNKVLRSWFCILVLTGNEKSIPELSLI